MPVLNRAGPQWTRYEGRFKLPASTDLERLRHSCAHVMATAILRLWPDAQFASGPAVENGFYYDVDLQHRISPKDFPAIEAEMKKEIKANHTFEKVVVTREQAIKADPANATPRMLLIDLYLFNRQPKPALASYQRFLELSNGKSPDEEFKARQRARILTKVLSK